MNSLSGTVGGFTWKLKKLGLLILQHLPLIILLFWPYILHLISSVSDIVQFNANSYFFLNNNRTVFKEVYMGIGYVYMGWLLAIKVPGILRKPRLRWNLKTITSKQIKIDDKENEFRNENYLVVELNEESFDDRIIQPPQGKEKKKKAARFFYMPGQVVLEIVSSPDFLNKILGTYTIKNMSTKVTVADMKYRGRWIQRIEPIIGDKIDLSRYLSKVYTNISPCDKAQALLFWIDPYHNKYVAINEYKYDRIVDPSESVSKSNIVKVSLETDYDRYQFRFNLI